MFTMLLALSTGAIVGIVAGAVVLLLLIIGIALYNGLIRLRNAEIGRASCRERVLAGV